MAQNKENPLRLYALVTQLFIVVIVLILGGYLLGRYVIFKTTVAGGIMAVIGGIIGIIYFIMEMILLDKRKKQNGQRD